MEIATRHDPEVLPKEEKGPHEKEEMTKADTDL
jgi:hypothetical protein